MTGRSLILLAGGLFLIFKATQEIYHKTEGGGEEAHTGKATATMGAALVQIALMDMIFSLDSIITAVGMVDEIALMVVAIVIAIVVMIVFADRVSDFVNENPSVKILALAFLLLIGVLLTAEGTGRHIEKGYIYFAMGFSLLVELLNMRYRSNATERRKRRAVKEASQEA
jgi:predicted tellurium resistance membrane protein TerC